MADPLDLHRKLGVGPQLLDMQLLKGRDPALVANDLAVRKPEEFAAYSPSSDGKRCTNDINAINHHHKCMYDNLYDLSLKPLLHRLRLVVDAC